MTNLYKEFTSILECHDKTVDDVLYISDETGLCYKPEKIIEFFKTVNYDSGFGINFINLNLKIVLKNGDFIIRGEYDGSEWFEYMKVPKLDVELVEPCNFEVMVLANQDLPDYINSLNNSDDTNEDEYGY